MFKKWLDLDIKAYHAARLNAAENFERSQAQRGARFRQCALEGIIAGMVAAVNPGRKKSDRAQAEHGCQKQTALRFEEIL